MDDSPRFIMCVGVQGSFAVKRLVTLSFKAEKKQAENKHVYNSPDSTPNHHTSLDLSVHVRGRPYRLFHCSDFFSGIHVQEEGVLPSENTYIHRINKLNMVTKANKKRHCCCLGRGCCRGP